MAQRNIQVLLVEDNPADAVMLHEKLSDTLFGEFAIKHVARLSDAIAMLDKQRFDVVVLDLDLPDSQGLATFQELQRKVRSVATVVLADSANETLAVRALQQGAQDWLVKGDMQHDMLARSIRYAIERKGSQESFQIAEVELAHLGRVSTMGQLASGLAHELNQPLGAILNYSSICMRQLESDSPSLGKMRDATAEIMNETRRASAIISRLRSFVRKNKPQRVAVDINALVEGAINMLGFELKHQAIHPTIRLAANLPKAAVDSIQIEQVLVNLIYNALEALGESPSADKQLSVETSVISGGGEIEVCVADTGVGSPPETIDKIFDAFFTTKPDGLGVGLNISRSIIESHGGRLSAAANSPTGMRFCFSLPAAEGGIA